MELFARAAPGSEVRFLNLERPFSNFEFIEKELGESGPLRRIFSQIRQHDGKTLVIERINQAREIVEEDEDLKSLKSDFIKSEVLRLSFFKRKAQSEKDLQDLPAEEFLGYAIIKKNNFDSNSMEPKIFESVIKKSRHANNCIPGAPLWKCRVCGRLFEIEGYLYAQQNRK